MKPLSFDEHGVASLDGVWDFFPGDHGVADLDSLTPQPIRVPGLWEAQGHLELDGVAWYRREVVLDDISGFWTLRFGAVMDVAEVHLNGHRLGTHDSPFTPFELDPGPALVDGRNVLAVRVFDPGLDDPEHLRLAHGKQGWANHVFPSRPSLYMTYGGIWQPVRLHRHGPVVLSDVFVNSDPDDLRISVDVTNRGAESVSGRVAFRAVGVVHEEPFQLAPGDTATVSAPLGATPARRWTPAQPALHHAHLDAVVVDRFGGRALSHACSARFGLRTVRLEGERMLISGEPYRMRSVLVQGFRSDDLYAEGTRRQIEEEVAAAKGMGFNTLRLHIKAFDPTYLDICDEMGMYLHCDIPVAEPIAHEEMGADTPLARRCVTAAQEQVRRDRNHPSIVLWSAMNEISLYRFEARSEPPYETFVRTIVGAIEAADPTRPVIENDWVDPDPERVYASPVLTAHWYGRLHSDYLDKIEAAAARWAGTGRPFFVTEFGDWGLPEMPELAEPPFWDTRDVYAAGLAGTLWPGTVGRFLIETQRYQGLSDRLQTEVFRRHDHIGGYCLTELTDVPAELNGLLDLDRRPKPMAVAEVTRANQVVLPMLHLDGLVVSAGEVITAPLHVANDGPALRAVEVEARFGGTVSPSDDQLMSVDASRLSPSETLARFGEWTCAVKIGDLPAYRASRVGEVALAAPDVPGSHDLLVTLTSGGTLVAENRYPIHVVARPQVYATVRLMGGGGGDPLGELGAVVGDRGPVIVGEGALDDGVAAEVRARLEAGDDVIVLAQPPSAAPHYPVPVVLEQVSTEWGSSQFHFTTDHGALSALPRRAVLAAEDSTIQARSVILSIDGRPFPETPVVIAYKPVPGSITGTVVGCHRVGAGRLILCQYRLWERASKGDAAARALLADLIRWAASPRATARRERLVKDDGRNLILYSFGEQPE